MIIFNTIISINCIINKIITRAHVLGVDVTREMSKIDSSERHVGKPKNSGKEKKNLSQLETSHAIITQITFLFIQIQQRVGSEKRPCMIE